MAEIQRVLFDEDGEDSGVAALMFETYAMGPPPSNSVAPVKDCYRSPHRLYALGMFVFGCVYTWQEFYVRCLSRSPCVFDAITAMSEVAEGATLVSMVDYPQNAGLFSRSCFRDRWVAATTVVRDKLLRRGRGWVPCCGLTVGF